MEIATELRLADPESLYGELAWLYLGLDEEAALALSAKIILILANHIGDRDLLRQAFALARGEAIPAT